MRDSVVCVCVCVHAGVLYTTLCVQCFECGTSCTVCIHTHIHCSPCVCECGNSCMCVCDTHVGHMQHACVCDMQCGSVVCVHECGNCSRMCV